MPDKIGKYIYWTPRILSILFIIFLSMFSLDVFEAGRSLGQILIALLMHNIPVIILTIILIISWKREIVSGIVFILAGLAYIALTFIRGILGDVPWYVDFALSLIIAGPALLIGILFLIGWYRKKKI